MSPGIGVEAPGRQGARRAHSARYSPDEQRRRPGCIGAEDGEIISTSRLSPSAYRRWFERPLGARVDADERAVLLEMARFVRGERVLEIGCGEGNFTTAIADRVGPIVALDRSREMLAAGRRRLAGTAGIRWLLGDGAALPFVERSFDAVVVVTVLCFAVAPEAVVAEAFRVLRPGGRIVLGELGRFSSWAVWRRFRGLLGHARWRRARFFSPSGLGSLLGRAGFVEPEVAGAVFYPPVPSATLLGLMRPLEAIGRRRLPGAGALLVARAHRPVGP